MKLDNTVVVDMDSQPDRIWKEKWLWAHMWEIALVRLTSEDACQELS